MPLLSNLRDGIAPWSPEEVWYHAIWKFEASYKEEDGDEHFLRVTMKIYANSDTTPPTDGADDREITYVYKVLYSGGSATNSPLNDWISVGDDGHYAPESLWAVSAPGGGWGGQNPFVTEANVRLLDGGN